MGSKKFGVTFVWGVKFFRGLTLSVGQILSEVKNFRGSTFFGVQKFVGGQIFAGVNNFLRGQQFSGSSQFLRGQTNVGVNFFGGWGKNVGRKNLGVKHLWRSDLNENEIRNKVRFI